MFAFAVAKATVDFPLFRSTLVGEDTMRTYDSLSLGIAVSLPADELVLAVVDRADRLTWREFAESVREKIELARSGKDQANESVTLSLTNMQSFGIRDAVPVVVPPSVATLFLGEVYVANDHRLANIALTFDHRIMNGVGAAQFMARIRDLVATIGESLD
jgi:pyruvate dehydrogenase E2 component (dihydrolipoamide acetyltransferase)